MPSEMRPVYGDKYFTRPAIHVWCKNLLTVKKVLLIWSPCCFDDQCNDRSGRFRHVVKTARDGINVYMNLNDMLKNETLMFDV